MTKSLAVAALIGFLSQVAMASQGLGQGQTLLGQGKVTDGTAQSRDFIGAPTFLIENSTSPVLLMSGPGLAFQVDASSGNSAGSNTSFCLGFDSATASGITQNTRGHGATPRVYTDTYQVTTSTFQAVTTTFIAPSHLGKWTADKGAYYANGFVGLSTDANTTCSFRLTSITALQPGQ